MNPVDKLRFAYFPAEPRPPRVYKGRRDPVCALCGCSDGDRCKDPHTGDRCSWTLATPPPPRPLCNWCYRVMLNIRDEGTSQAFMRAVGFTEVPS